MLSKWFFVVGVACALASGALFAQDLAIDGKDFESGAADAKLAEIARQAAASGKTIVVTTPPYWQSKVTGKMRAAAPGVRVRTNDAFFENVLVRIVDADKAAKPDALAAKSVEPAAAPKPVEPAAAPKPAEPAPAAKPAPRAEARIAATAPVSARKEEAAPPPEPAPATPAASHAVVASSATPPATAPAAASAQHAARVASVTSVPAAAPRPAPVGADAAAIKRSFENQFNQGRPASGAIGPVQLQNGDEIFVRGSVRAAVRRERSRVQLFWLEGDLNFDRAELLRTDDGRYRVIAAIRESANPTLRAMHSVPQWFRAEVPAERSQVRRDMERHFNDAKPIGDRLQPKDLRYGDLFYIYRQYAVVFRRTELGFDRYWLEGEVDLNQAGVIKTGDAWRIVSERL